MFKRREKAYNYVKIYVTYLYCVLLSVWKIDKYDFGFLLNVTKIYVEKFIKMLFFRKINMK